MRKTNNNEYDILKRNIHTNEFRAFKLCVTDRQKEYYVDEFGTQHTLESIKRNWR